MRAPIVFLAAATLACTGPGPAIDQQSDLTAFTGYWNGAASSKSNGIESARQPASFVLVELEAKTLEVVGVCSDGSGPRATVTSATTLTLGGVRCPPVSVTGCSEVTLALESGTGTLANGSLQLDFAGTVSGCTQSFPYTISFSGRREAPQSHKPVAVITGVPSTSVTLGSTVTLDGRTSTDPLTRRLSWYWTLAARPTGSTALLTGSNASQASFRPDVVGSYIVSLVVTAEGGETSSTVFATIGATNSTVNSSPPDVVVSAPTAAVPGQVVRLDASHSSSLSGFPLSFTWTLTSAPAGSVAALANADTSVATLQPTILGAYTAKVVVTDGLKSTEKSVTFEAKRALTTMLPFRPTAAKYSRALDRLIFLSDGPPALHLYDPVTRTDTSMTLPLTATCLSLGSDGLFAAIGHDAWVTYVDLAKASIIKSWPLSAPAGDVVLGDPITLPGDTPRDTRFAYVFPSRDQWVQVHSLDLGTGAETTAGGTIYAGMRAVLQPSTGHVFGVTTSLSPVQTYRFDVNPTTGVLAQAAESPYWGSYPMGAPLWPSADGAQLLTSAGTRFRTSDLTYAGKVASSGYVNGASVSLLWADVAPDGQSWLVQPTGYSYTTQQSYDTWALVVDATYLADVQKLPYPVFVSGGTAYDVHGRYVFFDASGTHRWVVGQVDSKAGALTDFGVFEP